MTYWFIFCKTDLLLQKQADGSYTIPCSEESPIALKPWTHVLNISPMEDGTEVKAFTINTPVTDNPNYEMCGLRPSYYKLSRDLYLKAGKCHELIYWDQNTQFCGICGAPMKMSTDISKKCTQCGKSVWPIARHCHHRPHTQGRGSPSGTCPQLQERLLWTCGWLCRDRRNP